MYCKPPITPITRRISREDIAELPHYVKTGKENSFEVTFPNDCWEDENTWFNHNVWKCE